MKVSYISLLTLLVFFLIPASVSADTLVDNFDSYTVGNLVPQGPWIYLDSSGTNPTASATTSQSFSSPNSVALQANQRATGFLVSTTTVASISYKLYWQPSSGTATNGKGLPQFCEYIGTSCSDSRPLDYMIRRNGSISYGEGASSNIHIASTTSGWNDIRMEYSLSGAYGITQVYVNGILATTTTALQNRTYTGFKLSEGGFTLPVYLDDLEVYTNGDVPVAGGITATRITSRLILPSSSPTASTSVPFQYNYFNGLPEILPGGQACVRIDDMVQFITLTPICQDITASGNGQFNATTTLTEAHVYRAVPFLLDENGVVVAEGQSTTFSVVTYSSSYVDYTALQGSASSTNNVLDDCDAKTGIDEFLCKAALFLIVPPQTSFNNFYLTLDVLPTKFPFSYFYAIVGAVQDIEDTASSTSPVSFAVDLTALSIYEGELDIISTTTVDAYLGSENRTLFRNVMSYGLWISFAIMIFFTVRKIFNQSS